MKPLDNPPRVLFYGLGNYGTEAARIVAEKGWPIVGAVNRAGPKVGKDLGEVIGLGRKLGVAVQDAATADYAGFGADICIIAQLERLRDNLPAYEQVMAAGINVVCHGAESYFPEGADPEMAKVVDALAKKHGVTHTGTGIWDFSRIWSGIGLAGHMTKIESIFHRSLTDAEIATKDLARVCGVSFTQDEFNERNGGMIGGLYKTVPHHVAWALGYDVLEVIERREPILSDKPVWSRLWDQWFDPGIVLGVRIVTDITTGEGVPITAHSELRILPEGESEHMFWEMRGRPACSIRVDRSDSLHMSAACLVNRAPDVIAAPPGTQVLSKLGILSPKAPF